MRNLLILSVAIGAGVFCLDSCSRRDQTARNGEPSVTTEVAELRFVNADSSGAAYDLWFGDQKVVANIDSKKTSNYVPVKAERKELKLRPAGSDTAAPIATNSEGLWKDRHYTVVAVRKENGEVTLNPVNDDTAMPDAGKARLRVINAAPELGEVDVAERGKKDKLFSGVNPNSASRYKSVDSTQPLEVRTERGQASSAQVADSLTSGKSYTLVVLADNRRRPEPMLLQDWMPR